MLLSWGYFGDLGARHGQLSTQQSGFGAVLCLWGIQELALTVVLRSPQLFAFQGRPLYDTENALQNLKT